MRFNHSVWHPFTNIKLAQEPKKVVKAEGVYLYLESGEKIIDAVSSWWTNTYGHAHPKIVQAIAQQAQQLEHVMFADLTHEPAQQLADELLLRLGAPFKKVFYTDNGSTATEVAMKMALQYWRNRNEKQRTTFIAFEGAYHGDTFGAMSTGATSVFNEAFEPLLFEVQRFEYPSTWIEDAIVEEREARILSQMEEWMTLHHGSVAALIVEPIVQGAGGMNMCRPEFIDKVITLMKRWSVLVLFDEVMTGFGRTGATFAFEHLKERPDFVCLSKGLTGGALPLAVTITTDEIFATFYHEHPLRTLYHGHSYTANPLGCAAALAALSLLDDFRPKFEGMSEQHANFASTYLDHSRVNRLRIMGTIMAFELPPHSTGGYTDSIGTVVREFAIERGALIRPLGNVVYLMPPYCITSKELEHLYHILSEFLETMS